MKTNYESIRNQESRKIIKMIGHYAKRQAKRTKHKTKTYIGIISQCLKDLQEYGIEKD